MKGKNNAGFSMIEVLVAIAILAGIAVPACSSLLLSLRMNARAEALLNARIAVSSAVETLMAEGVSDDSIAYVEDNYPVDVTYTLDEEAHGYAVTVTGGEDVAVKTFIRAAESSDGTGGGGQ